MAQLNCTLSQEEILQLLRSEPKDASEAFKKLLQNALNEFLQYESAEKLKAKQYERSDERTDQRNGTRDRELTTKMGTLILTVPRHREEPFHTMLFNNYQRNEAALLTTMAEMVISGTSTRKVGKVMETICGKEFSKSTVSEACKMLDTEVKKFRERPIEEGKFPFIMLDATYFKCREEHRVVSKAFMVAIGITDNGSREVLGFAEYDDESNSTWSSFIKSLKSRGLSGVLIYTSDAHSSIRHAMNAEFPDAAWQRCQFHFMKNILDEVPKKCRMGIETELREMFNCETIEDARKLCREIISEYEDVAEKAMEILDDGFEDSMTVMMIPTKMRRPLRTSNMVERLNKELKRRSNVINVFPNAASILRLMGSVTIDYHDVIVAKKPMFYPRLMKEISDHIKLKLIKLAHDQAQRAKVA